MTIRSGRDWGELVDRPSNLHVMIDDRHADDFLDSNLDLGAPAPNMAIVSSEFARTLGLSGANAQNSKMLCTPFDLIEATIFKADNLKPVRRYFLGNALVRNRFWLGNIISIHNSSFRKGRNWTPRGHPNDGKMDVVIFDASMNIRQRMRAFHLMKSGSHIPHPKIQYFQTPEFSTEIVKSASLHIEGQKMADASRCEFRLLADAVNLFW